MDGSVIGPAGPDTHDAFHAIFIEQFIRIYANGRATHATGANGQPAPFIVTGKKINILVLLTS
jgi:hypothetical protein